MYYYAVNIQKAACALDILIFTAALIASQSSLTKIVFNSVVRI